MRICIIGINFHPEETGCAPYNTDLAENIFENGMQVDFVTGFPHYPSWSLDSRYKGKVRSLENYGGINLIRLRHYIPRNGTVFGRILYEISFGVHAWIYSRRIRADLTLVITPSLLSILPALRIKGKGSRIKVLVQDILSGSLEQSRGKRYIVLSKLIKIVESYLFRRADEIAVVSERFATKLNDLGVKREKLSVLPNFTLPKLLEASLISDKEKWRFPLSKKIVLYTGNMGAKQNLDRIVKAAKILETSNPDVLICLVGEGSEKEALMKAAKTLSNIEFRSPVESTEYMSLLASADLLLSHESLGIRDMSVASKITSYRASQKPILVVCSKESPTYYEVIKFGLHHCDSIDSFDLSEAICNTLALHTNSDFNPHFESDLRRKRLEWALC